jgi:hypothetical protein
LHSLSWSKRSKRQWYANHLCSGFSWRRVLPQLSQSDIHLLYHAIVPHRANLNWCFETLTPKFVITHSCISLPSNSLWPRSIYLIDPAYKATSVVSQYCASNTIVKMRPWHKTRFPSKLKRILPVRFTPLERTRRHPCLTCSATSKSDHEMLQVQMPMLHIMTALKHRSILARQNFHRPLS